MRFLNLGASSEFPSSYSIGSLIVLFREMSLRSCFIMFADFFISLRSSSIMSADFFASLRSSSVVPANLFTSLWSSLVVSADFSTSSLRVLIFGSILSRRLIVPHPVSTRAPPGRFELTASMSSKRIMQRLGSLANRLFRLASCHL